VTRRAKAPASLLQLRLSVHFWPQHNLFAFQPAISQWGPPGPGPPAPPPKKTKVWLPIVNEEASTDSRVAVEGHELMFAEVAPVTETVAPTVRSVVSVVLARAPMETNMGVALPLAVNRKPSIEPSPE
jgi:hypothetical protein